MFWERIRGVRPTALRVTVLRWVLRPEGGDGCPRVTEHPLFCSVLLPADVHVRSASDLRACCVTASVSEMGASDDRSVCSPSSSMPRSPLRRFLAAPVIRSLANRGPPEDVRVSSATEMDMQRPNWLGVSGRKSIGCVRTYAGLPVPGGSVSFDSIVNAVVVLVVAGGKPQTRTVPQAARQLDFPVGLLDLEHQTSQWRLLVC